METLTQIVYQLATAMLAPVLVALLAIFGWSLFALGAFLREWRQRRLDDSAWERVVKTYGPDDLLEDADGELPSCSGFRGEFLTAIRNGVGASPEKTLADFEVQASGRLAWMSFGVRTGPLLGLMGTLIPMGPALIGLSAGDIESMARNLVIVFSTTVVGVFIGGLCYTMLLVRRQWYAHDLADIEFVVSRLAERSFDQAETPPRVTGEERCA